MSRRNFSPGFQLPKIPFVDRWAPSNKVLRGTVILTAGRMAGYAFSFVRNMLLARLLAKADYGLASVFAMATTLLEIGGSMGFGMQIVQSKEGDTERFQASAHALQFVGGLCSATLLVGLSVPFALLFKVPHSWWAFALLGMVPLCQGLSHLDVARRQRELDYIPLIFVDLVPQLLITIAVWPLVVWLRDYRAIVCLMIAKAICGTAATFVLAQRPYRWGWDRAYILKMLGFGWPLLLSSLVMFGSQQADQMLIGSVFSLNLLANYALAFSLVSIPWFIFSQVGGSLMLPLMSRAQDDFERLRHQYRLCVDMAVIAGAVFTLPLIMAGEQLVTLVFGLKYQGSGVFVALLGASIAVRFLRSAPAYAAAAKGDTLNQLYSYLWRGLSLPLALAVVGAAGTPVQVASCALIGEVSAAVVSVVRLRRRQGVPLRDTFRAGLYLTTTVSVAVGITLLGGARLGIPWIAVVTTGTLLFAVVSAWFMFPNTVELLNKNSGRNHRVAVPDPVLTT